MKLSNVLAFSLFATFLVVPFTNPGSVASQAATEAPTSIDLTTNGFVDQATMDSDRAEFEQIEGTGNGLGPLYNANSCAVCHANPVTGAESMVSELRAGHDDEDGYFVAATVTTDDGTTIPNRSLINDRAICPGMVADASGVSHDFQQTNIQERVPGAEYVRAFRRTTNVLGDGFVEAIDDATLVRISNTHLAKAAAPFTVS
jgi:hypothetical protein